MSYSTFQSQWPAANQRVQREVALLSVKMDKILVFKAGPFNEMSLATFVAVSFLFLHFKNKINYSARYFFQARYYDLTHRLCLTL